MNEIEMIAYLYYYANLEIGKAEKIVGNQFLIEFKLNEMNETLQKLKEKNLEEYYVFKPIHKIYLKEKEAILGTNGTPYFSRKKDNELTRKLIQEAHPALLEGMLKMPECCPEKKPDFFAYHYTNIVDSATKNRELGFKYQNKNILKFYESIKKNLNN